MIRSITTWFAAAAAAAALAVPGIARCAEGFSPWAAWREGYELTRKGESARDRGDYRQAVILYGQAALRYRELKKARPDWNQQVIDTRLNACDAEIAKARRALGEVETAPEPGTRVPADSPAPADGNTGAAAPGSSESEGFSARRELEESRKKLYQTMVELEETRKKLRTLDSGAAEAETLMKENRELTGKLLLRERQYRELEEKLNTPNAELKSLREQLLEMQRSLGSARNRLKLADERIARQEQDLRDANRNAAAGTAELRNAAAELANREKELVGLRAFRRAALEAKNGELTKIEELDRQLEQWRKRDEERKSEIEKLDQRLRDSLKKGGDVGALNAELAAENRSMRNRLETLAARCETAVRDRQELEKTLRAAQLESGDLKSSLLAAEENRKKIESSLQTRTGELTKLREAHRLADRELGNVQNTLRERDIELRTARDQADALANQLKTERAVNTRAAQRADELRRGLENENVQYGVELKELRAVRLRLTSENEKLAAEAARLKTEAIKLESGVNSADRDRREAAELRRRVAAQDATLEKAKSELAAARALEPRLETAGRDLENARKRLRTLEPLREELLNAARKNQELAAANARLETALRQANARTAAAPPPAPDRSVEVAELQKQLGAARLIRDEIAAKLDAAVKRAVELGTANDRLEAALRRSQDLLKTNAAHMDETRKNQQILDANAKAVQSEIDRRNRELTETNRKLAEAEKRNRELAETGRKLAEAEKRNRELAEINRKLADDARHVKPVVTVTVADAPKPEIKPFAGAELKIPELLAGAARAESAGDVEVARWNYRMVLEGDPENRIANARLGALHLKREDYKQAVPLLARAHLADPENLGLRLDYADALLGVNQSAAALAAIETEVSKRPEHPRLGLLWGRALAACGDNRAENALRHAAELDPNSAGANLELAKFLAEGDEKKSDEAAQYYQRAKKRGAIPVAELEKKLGKKLNEQGELIEFLSAALMEAEASRDEDSVLWYAGKLAELEPDNPLHTLKLNGYQFRKNQPDAAVALWALRRNTPEAAFVSALAAAARKKFPDADRELNRCDQLARGTFVLAPEAALLRAETAKIAGTAPAPLKSRLLKIIQ